MRRQSAFLLLLSLVLTSIFIPTPAWACSCASSHPRLQLRNADAAFVGTVVDVKRPAVPFLVNRKAVWRFEIEHAVKGRLRRVEHVRSPDSGAACGLELAVGERAGIILSGDEGDWTSGLCSMLAPDGLLAAGRAPPRPVGGEIAFLAAADVAGSQSIALDEQGRIAAYGLPPEDRNLDFENRAGSISICPGGRVALEMSHNFGVHARDLGDFKIKSILLAGPFPPAWISCVNDRGPEFLLGINDHDTGNDRIERRRGQELLRTEEVSGRVAAVKGQEAYVFEHDGHQAFRLWRLELETGSREQIGIFQGYSSAYPSPDGARLVVVEYPRLGNTVWIHSLSTAGARLAPALDLGRGLRQMTWVDDSQFFVSRILDPQQRISPESTVYRPDLTVIRRINVGLTSIAAADGQVYGFDQGAFIKVDPATGKVTRLTEIDDGMTSELVALPPPRPLLGPGWKPEMPPLAELISSGSLIAGRPRTLRSSLVIPALILIGAVLLGLLERSARHRATTK